MSPKAKFSPEEMEKLLDNIYNAFDVKPLPAGDPTYVECRDVRGDVEIEEDLGRRIQRAKENTCYLYAGYRGSGKTTELNRLRVYLEKRKFHVVYFEADKEDISAQDTEYEDILLACTRQLVQQVKEGNSQPIRDWLTERWNDLKDFLNREVQFNGGGVDVELNQFIKLTAAIRTEPSQRQKIREKIKPHTETLIKALNQFIQDAQKHLPAGKEKLIVIVDSLDRIVPIFRDGKQGRSNYDEIFIDRHEQLSALDCHVLYTVPISLLYSQSATSAKDLYGFTTVLPSILVRNPDGVVFQAGIDKLKEAISLRIQPFVGALDLETEVFESKEILENMCLMSGGYILDLVQLVQEAVNRTDELPIREKAVQRAIDELRAIYQRAVEEPQWEVLAKVHLIKEPNNENLCRSLLFNRCLLEYRKATDQEVESKSWCDVHPILLETSKFKKALKSQQSQQ